MPDKRPSKSLAVAESLTRLLDSKFKIPGTNFSFGLDPILGLLPGVGDGVSLLVQLVVVYNLLQKGSSGKLRALLFINVLVDSFFGSIPVIGQIWDFFFKANERNLRLTKEYLYEDKHQGNGGRIWLAFALLLIICLGAIIYVLIELFKWLVSLF